MQSIQTRITNLNLRLNRLLRLYFELVKPDMRDGLKEMLNNKELSMVSLISLLSTKHMSIGKAYLSEDFTLLDYSLPYSQMWSHVALVDAEALMEFLTDLNDFHLELMTLLLEYNKFTLDLYRLLDEDQMLEEPDFRRLIEEVTTGKIQDTEEEEEDDDEPIIE